MTRRLIGGIAALLAAACGGGGSGGEELGAEPVGDGPSGDSPRGEGQRADGAPVAGGEADAPARPALEWRPCGELACAELMVPLDREQPDGEQIPIALNRIRRAPGVPSSGVLLINPGGPGEPGKPLVEALAPVWSQVALDVIGFDPRGTGDSAGLDCADPVDLLDAFLSDGLPAYFEALRRAEAACRASAGDLIDHLGSNAVVADIEQIRLALGAEQINFIGISYGTRLGALYAQTHPGRVRALVLDAPVPAVASLERFVTEQFEATLVQHEALLAGCESGALPCPPNAREMFQELLQSAPSPQERARFAAGWGNLLATPIGRDLLIEVLTGIAEEQAAGGGEMDMGAVMDAMDPEGMAPALVPEIALAVNRSVHCADDASEPLAGEAAAQLLESFTARSEPFALRALDAAFCSGWSVASDPVATIAFSPEVPPLIVGGTADTLTPIAFAEELSEAIEGSVLLRSEHYGHSAFLFSECASFAMGTYLRSLELPAPGTVCPAP